MIVGDLRQACFRKVCVYCKVWLVFKKSSPLTRIRVSFLLFYVYDLFFPPETLQVG